MYPLIIVSQIMLWLLNLFILFALFLLFRQFGTVYLSSAEAISRDGIPVGIQMPTLRGKPYGKGEESIADLLIGEPVLMVFISPTCRACQQLLDDWNTVYEKYKDRVRFVLVGIGTEKEIAPLLAGKGIQGDIILDAKRDIMADCKVRVTPFAFVLDRDAVVRGKGLCNHERHMEHLLSDLDIERM